MTWLLLACARPVTPPPPAGPPFERHARACETGVLTQVVDAGSYTYLAYTDPTGASRWLATLAVAPPALGTTQSFVWYGEQADFHSNRLDRDFELLRFGFIGACSPTESET